MGPEKLRTRNCRCVKLEGELAAEKEEGEAAAGRARKEAAKAREEAEGEVLSRIPSILGFSHIQFVSP